MTHPPATATATAPLVVPQTAHAVLKAGRFRASARVRVTPLGLVAIGGLVSAILLSVPPIVRAAGDVAAKRPRG